MTREPYIIIRIFIMYAAFASFSVFSEWHWRRSDTISRYEDAEIRAILDVLAYAEGTYAYGDDGYKMIYGGSTFDDFGDHPRVVICLPYRGKPLCATAAGRYQILERTFDRLGLPDFSPASQDAGAKKLLAENGIMDLVKTQHNFKDIVIRLNKTWATLPGAPYGQPTKRFAELHDFYQDRYTYHKKNLGVR